MAGSRGAVGSRAASAAALQAAVLGLLSVGGRASPLLWPFPTNTNMKPHPPPTHRLIQHGGQAIHKGHAQDGGVEQVCMQGAVFGGIAYSWDTGTARALHPSSQQASQRSIGTSGKVTPVSRAPAIRREQPHPGSPTWPHVYDGAHGQAARCATAKARQWRVSA